MMILRGISLPYNRQIALPRRQNMEDMVVRNHWMQALEAARPLRVSQWLSHIMKPRSGQLFSVSQLRNCLSTSGEQQQEAPPAEVEAVMPIMSLSPDTPSKLARGTIQLRMPLRLRQLRQTSLRQSRLPPATSYQLLQAWGWQRSMAESASRITFTKQLQAWPAVSAEQSATPWQTATHSGETTSILEVPIFSRSCRIMLATVRGVTMQLSMSMSTPSRDHLVMMESIEFTKLVMLSVLAKMQAQLPFCPPTEISTFCPAARHSSTAAVGKLASSMKTDPSGLVFTKDRMTLVAPGVTSLSSDWPQNQPPKPQQNMESSYCCAFLGWGRLNQLTLAARAETSRRVSTTPTFINQILLFLTPTPLQTPCPTTRGVCNNCPCFILWKGKKRVMINLHRTVVNGWWLCVLGLGSDRVLMGQWAIS